VKREALPPVARRRVRAIVRQRRLGPSR